VTDDGSADLDARLHRVAVGFILPVGPDVEAAVALAEELVASGDSGPVTLALAAMGRKCWLSETEDLILGMLEEHGIDVPRDVDERGEYRTLLRAVGYWGLPVAHLEGPFYVRVPGWDDQGPLDRALVTLFDSRDHETTPVERSAIEEEIRAEVRRYIQPR
jgi:hypothetical protein